MVAERVGVKDGETVLVASAELAALTVTSAEGLTLAVPVVEAVWLVLVENDFVAETLLDLVCVLEMAADGVTEADTVPVLENERDAVGVDK